MSNFLIRSRDVIRDVTSRPYEHMVGTCPYCGARVYTKLSCRGFASVCLCPGEVHTSPICMAQASKTHQPVAGLTTKESFFQKIYERIPRKAQRHAGKKLVKKAREDCDYRAVASAKDLRLSRYLDLGPQFEMWGDDISKTAMRAEWLPRCYPTDLSGQWIILAQFDELDEKELTCELSMSNMGYYARFLVQGTDATMYDFFEALCCYRRDDKNGAVIVLQSKYSGVYFISADWKRKNCTPEECDRAGEQGCDKCFGCYITGLVSPRQYSGAR